MQYKTHGVCTRRITFDVKDHKLTNVHFEGGCAGNTQGLPAWWREWISTRLSVVWMESAAASSPPPARISWPRP